jgi:hypothetical protein
MGNELESFWFNGRTQIGADLSEFGDDLVGCEPVKIVPLTPAGDGGKDFVGFCRRKKEFNSAGRFFESF